MQKEEIVCQDTDELFALLDPNNSYWNYTDSPRTELLNRNGWLFRGQMDSNWSLQPSAFRPNAFLKFIWWLNLSSVTWETDHFIVAELASVKEFLKISDSYGISTPMKSDLGEIIGEWIGKANYNIENTIKKEIDMPPKQLIEAFALAQHHGIPTRLLDWSYSAYHSLFFAAYDSWTQPSPDRDGYLSIWAINKLILELDDLGKGRIQLLHSPYSSNQYLMNQAGIFTYDSMANPYHRQYNQWQCQDDIFESYSQKRMNINPVRKISIHWKFSKEILIKLVERRINPVSLMPTLDNVTKTMEFSQKLFGR